MMQSSLWSLFNQSINPSQITWSDEIEGMWGKTLIDIEQLRKLGQHVYDSWPYNWEKFFDDFFIGDWRENDEQNKKKLSRNGKM